MYANVAHNHSFVQQTFTERENDRLISSQYDCSKGLKIIILSYHCLLCISYVYKKMSYIGAFDCTLQKEMGLYLHFCKILSCIILAT